ncbi:acetoin dehydrogenase dihydrolipoyllysine-residue acetyltransferase subunit [Xinfangfangia sp. CPCC 101601]|uniref:Acetoin dehydrogenase dihydrolipoyllysine-residue acetyltransferase subunit n=1 Tax=Pseudogemmobacter lacusdianii TaxID=3069608 RepID=A0ABU0W2P3_9RHOB|nr:acetoin dehydrogenase dihydrolipoyllysine-residue acetyltransferase subunit [Xinfangfangia sp. CPCC 101601]MDQ2068234.1 acetoin dehydrogenase dihydrolipoyllysine-residue acetyltransferase subunit [Xinfangfangia sp. CPCC 101601]
MPVPVLYPKVSLEMSSGKISRWLVAEGATVAAGDVIFEIENDKAAVEVEAPAAGVLRGLVAEGVEVEVGEPVARVVAPGEQDIAAPAAAPAAAPVAAAAAAPAPTAAAAPAAAPAQSQRPGPNPTPLARRIARENGISLNGVAGSGPRGRVQRSDVMAELARLAESPATPAPRRAAPVAALAAPRAAVARPVLGDEMLHGDWLRRGDGLPVVLLHGFSADLNNWRGMLAGARPEWPAFALDLPCHGRSPRVLPADLDGIAEMVEARLIAEGINSCLLAAHSFGGAVAARIAARGAVDVQGLCLFSPAGLYPSINEDFTHGILRATTAESLRPWLQELVHNPAVITPVFEQATAKAREDVDLTTAMQDFAAQFFADGTQCFSIRADLATLHQPVKVIFGREDKILPFASTKALPGHIGLHALEQCGHMPHIEESSLSLRLLSELWRSAL